MTSISQQSVMEYAASIAGLEHVEATGSACSVAPADAQQAAHLLRYANEKGLVVCIEGAGTKSPWLDEAPAEIRLRTSRMNQVREHTWQDMTCSVDAGCGWQSMQSTLAQHGQHVALDPLWPERATVGGVLGANDSGSLRLRYGGLRDLVIGMTIVLADGTVARSGGKVVKNVAGYDLPKLLCGSFGTLALITEVTFRLHSIARHSSSITVLAASAEPLNDLLLRLLDAHFSVQSMQLRAHKQAFALDVRLAALPEVASTQQDGVIAMAESTGLKTEPSHAGAWAARENLFAGARFVVKATLLPSAIGRTVQAMHDLGGSVVAQATGILTVSFPNNPDVRHLTHLRAQLEAAGGSLTVLIAAGEAVLDRWGTLPSSFPVMRAVKENFDPKRTLNRGRFLGGL
ncbi:glycolate oxidase FAD binding subunit [Granulicella pectinivorans]|uniref:Glycolate oxidase FAD binding subunit n=1 Tax=Granulicella pectinivorans TaxID=474950 RepID=A0A1I6MR15_9BACT|nr:FAD-binding oxidoreductase [Granulicella pectinivorans]SFS18122.1 glycolate oxidase FAD binding subunit [Granulicella pectinivorans]